MTSNVDTLARVHAMALAAMAAVADPPPPAAAVGAALSPRERELLSGYSQAALAKIEAVLMRLPAPLAAASQASRSVPVAPRSGRSGRGRGRGFSGGPVV
jgi:hypothetical protein